jgi:hypothetical protein
LKYIFFFISPIGPALIQFRDDSHRRLSPPVHFDEHHRHHLPSTEEQLIRLSTSSTHRFQPHLTSLPQPLLGGSSSPTRIHHQHHQFVPGQPPPLLPTPPNNDEHQKQSPFPRRPTRFEEREDVTHLQDNNNGNFRGGRPNYNDRPNPSGIPRGPNRGRGGTDINKIHIIKSFILFYFSWWR